ncbi:MAG: phosphatase PAP2 family protein [Gammaproteobacteria bacterium]|nr:phosphatase PAP2 family protein [Gammaproteobacteria bacterium]
MSPLRLEQRLYLALVGLFALLLLISFLPGVNLAGFRLINGWGTGFEQPWAGINLLGDTLVTVTLFLPFIWRRPEVVWAAVLSALLATVVVHGLKSWLAWPRPLGVLPSEEVHLIGHALYAQSFPSGHSASIATAAGVLALSLRMPWWGGLLVAGVAVVAGLARTVVGAHWPQDVAAGVFIGWVAAWVGVRLADRWPVNRRFGQPLMALLLLGCLAQFYGFDGGYPEGRWMLVPVALWAVLGSAWVLWRANRPWR